jgi:hypothetical protein
VKQKKKAKMSAMFRSEEMTLCQMFIQPEAAYSSVSELGETGAVQFRDVRINISHLFIKKIHSYLQNSSTPK